METATSAQTAAPTPVPAPAPSPASPERDAAQVSVWPLWQRVAFRFFCVYWLLQITPWAWFSAAPGTPFILGLYEKLVDWAVYASNDRFFHVRATLIPTNGSGDTSYAWAQLWLYLSLALMACVLWSVIDRKRRAYPSLSYWLRMIVRYYVASAALGYGIIKIFALQMGFPTTSQLATPLGDLLPMRFSWLFIGYSVPYQVFSGVMETVAGLLLLYRPTITLGLFAATGAFLNVVMINLGYDVPVKLYSSHLLVACLFLLAMDAPRLFNLLVLNRPVPATQLYDQRFTLPWQVWGSRAVKTFFLFQLVYAPFMSGYERFRSAKAAPKPGPFRTGVYDVTSYTVNGVPHPDTPADTIRWQDVIFDSQMAGSINSRDQLFQQRYRRAYFRFKPDTIAHTAVVWKTSTIPGDSTFLFTMRYALPDTNHIRLEMVIRGDSVAVELARTARHFQLAERQFHWLSEYNR
jgi:hypothetical protein